MQIASLASLRNRRDRAPLPVTPCRVCGEPTQENKPWCSRHVEESPYVQGILRELEARRAAANPRAPLPESLITDVGAVALDRGAATPEAVHYLCGVPLAAARRAVREYYRHRARLPHSGVPHSGESVAPVT